MKTALLISTYNWPEALELTLKSVLNQSKTVDEVLIADDGSDFRTQDLIETFKDLLPIIHVWQEDNGFRKSQILNKAIAKSNADYIIQIDGDCILHRNFIEDHLNNSKENTFLYGSRVNILPNCVKSVFAKQQIKFGLFSNEIKNKTRNIHCPILAKLYRTQLCLSKKFRGCNVSYWKKDFLKTNGYNEDFEGWGREDSDLAIRLLNCHVYSRRLRYAGILYHIHHKENSKHNLELNDQIQNETIRNKTSWTKNGIDKYLV